MTGRWRRRFAFGLLLGAMTIPLAACGDDDDDDGTATGSATVSEEGSDGASGPGSDSVSIDMVDYGFDVSGPLVAGGTIKAENKGSELHEIGIGKLRDGVAVADVVEALEKQFAASEGEGEGAEGEGEGEGEGGEEEDPFDKFLEKRLGAPGSIYLPGSAAELTVPNVEAGNYLLVCFIPTAGEGVPHIAKGMVGQLTVVDGEAEEPEPDATYTVTPGKAIEGPATLKAGRNVLKITGTDIDNLEPVLVKPDEGKTFEDMNRAFDSLFQSETGPPKDLADKIPGELVVALFDIGDAGSIYIAADLTPGTYELVAEDTDTEDEVASPKERIVITVT